MDTGRLIKKQTQWFLKKGIWFTQDGDCEDGKKGIDLKHILEVRTTMICKALKMSKWVSKSLLLR